MKIDRIPIYCIAAIAFCCIAVKDTSASKVKPLNIRELTTSAKIIFEGECVKVRSGKDADSGLLATWYTFRIKTGIKGKVGDEYTFKQFGGSDGDVTVHVPTVTYREGETVILFLYGDSEIGFSSSVGMNQGKFAVQKIPDTEAEYVTNGMPAMLLFKDEPQHVSTLDAKGAKAVGSKRLSSKNMDRKEFIAEIERLVKQTQKETQ
ncbi:MAG: hypothetical protein C4527_05915 [Candidatus Omnitrophota bacterium]|jgi:hypothetical protein|nr:MAG: hypothetical protein C4527_05915 [Candidatus Omnitrophota bacterium]